MVAARQVLLERGAVGLRVKDVAERAGLAPSSVLYYYPDVGDQMLEVARGAMERYAARQATVEPIQLRPCDMETTRFV